MSHIRLSPELAPAVAAVLRRALANETDRCIRRDAGDALIEIERGITRPYADSLDKREW